MKNNVICLCLASMAVWGCTVPLGYYRVDGKNVDANLAYTCIAQANAEIGVNSQADLPDRTPEQRDYWLSTYQGCVIVGKINPDIVAKIESEDAAARAKGFEDFGRALMTALVSSPFPYATMTRYNINGHTWTCWTTQYSVTCK